MITRSKPLSLLALLFSTALAFHASAATLTGPANVVAPGEDYLSVIQLGFPSQVWAITLLEWEQTAAVDISAEVSTVSSDLGNLVFMNLNNNTADDWAGFEISVTGPATITNPGTIPPSINRLLPAGPPDITLTSITFNGLNWSPNDFQTTISFGLDVTPPVAGESVVLSLRPIAVPEPSSLALLAIGWAMASRRRSCS